MFAYTELMELEELCAKDPLFAKYIKLLKDENHRLLAKITHEIGNPLTIIYSTLQLMETRNPALPDEKYWLQLKEDVKDLSLLLQDYANYSSCNSLNLHEEDLYEILQSVSKSFEPVSFNHTIEILLDVSEDMLPAMNKYTCDKIKLKQVFINVIKNAVEALSDNGYIKIKVPEKGVLVEDLVQGKDCIIIVFENNGAQITPDELKGMFMPTFSTKTGGSGIGLYISSKIIEAHSGLIFVDSNKEQTAFTICLPL